MSAKPYLMKNPVLVESELAFLLRLELGDLYAWRDFLVDARRGRHSDYSLPWAFKAGGRFFYHMSDVTSFIKQVRDVYPEADGHLPIVVEEAADVASGKKIQKIGKYSALSGKAKRLLH